MITTAFGSPPGPVSALVGHVSDACGPLVTRTGEHLIHALARDAQRTGELGLIGPRLMRSQQGAAKVASSRAEVAIA